MVLMKQKFRPLIVSFLLFATPTPAAILQSDSLSFLEKQIASLDERDLVVFDMDDVLIVPQDAILHEKARKELQKIESHYMPHISQAEKIHLSSYVWKNATTVLVEPQIPALIASLQNQGVKVIVLTAAQVGRFGVIDDILTFRIRELKEKGISLVAAFPEIDILELTELNQGKGSPVFSQGVILSNRFPKGKVLANFLAQINWKPRRLVFIDDLFVNHESMEEELSEVADLQCWHFTGTEKHIKEIDYPIAHLQIRTLFAEKIWLSDAEAKLKLLENSNALE
jgi:hypothetical protein